MVLLGETSTSNAHAPSNVLPGEPADSVMPRGEVSIVLRELSPLAARRLRSSPPMPVAFDGDGSVGAAGNIGGALGGVGDPHIVSSSLVHFDVV